MRYCFFFDGDWQRVYWVQRAKTEHGDGWRYCGFIGGRGYGYSHPVYATGSEAAEALRAKIGAGRAIVWADPLPQ
jgi:hypothetical protein